MFTRITGAHAAAGAQLGMFDMPGMAQGCGDCMPGGRFGHVMHSGAGKQQFEAHCRGNMKLVLQQDQGMDAAQADAFIKNNCELFTKRVKYEDVDALRSVECACVITAPQQDGAAGKAPRLHVRLTYFTHTGAPLLAQVHACS